MKKNIAVLFIVLGLLGLAVFQSYSSTTSATVLPKEQAPKVNFLAPEFTLEGLDGKIYSITGGKRDKAVLINFWASWCGPCHQEAPDLIELYEQYSDRLDIYAINVTQSDTIKNAKEFVERYQFKFPILMDIDNDATNKYKIRAFPTNILVDKNGVIQEIFPSMLLPNDLKKIRRFLK